MIRRRNPLKIVYPDRETYQKARQGWPEHFIDQCLERVWLAWENLYSASGSRLIKEEWNDIVQKERGLAALHVNEILELQSSEDLFVCKPEVDEFESLHSPKAMPPRYDIAFTLRKGNPRILFPLEAKIIEKSTSITAICKDFTDKYLTGKGAPLSNVAVLIGYLLSGNSKEAFSNIEKEISTTLTPSSSFPNKSHRESTSDREPSEQFSDRKFLCHWMICNLKN